MFDPIAKEKEVRLKADLSEHLMISGDKYKLQRLVSNLLENAIKYNTKGGTVTITTGKENQHIAIELTDTGIGIPKSELPHIFKRFYRCDQSRSQEGIGLGLSLAKAIANALGGDIQVKSALNQGSTFMVILPVS